MEVLAPIFAWGLQAACNTSLAPWIPTCDQHQHQEIATLIEKLSPKAKVFLPSSQEFLQETLRWSALEQPTFRASVSVATEDDVVKYANEHNIPFLAVNTGHGSNMATDKVKDGIRISLRNLNSIEISPDGQSVTLGGGVLTKEVTDALWDKNKQTVTGFCECTGYVGPALGGGHGALQGRYGLIADQILSMRVVLADGTVQDVDHTSDLWWAMRGAGHNFGIVTSVTTKIYDVKHPSWAQKSFIFQRHQAGDVYSVLNDKVGKLPADVQIHSIVMYNPETSAVQILVLVLQEGVENIDRTYLDPLERISGTALDQINLDYVDLPALIDARLDDAVCQKAAPPDNLVKYRLPIYLDSFNSSAMQDMIDTFEKYILDYPEISQSIILVEGYGVEAVQKVALDSTAVSGGRQNLLVSPVILASASDHVRIKDQVKTVMADMMHKLHQAGGSDTVHGYVNYAYGDEPVESIYGDGNRLRKLRELKNKYDPHGWFNFYSPIV